MSSFKLPTLKMPQRPKGGPLQWAEDFFHIRSRGSSWPQELRAGLVLFMTSAYILFLNPLILSGASAGTNTGMPAEDVVLATAISTGVATLSMGLVAGYPWVVSVQLGTNTYFVNNVLQPFLPCGHHSYFTQGVNNVTGLVDICAGDPCTCSDDGQSVLQVGTAADPGPCYGTQQSCLGTKIPFEQALSATFLEGLVFLLICFTGMRSRLLKLLPKTVLMAGACGIGIFIAFVGLRDMGVIVAAPYPTLTKLASTLPYGPDGWGSSQFTSGVTFNSCVMYFDGPPFSVFCPWLSIGGLVFTGILLLWNINGAFIFGILFTMFISWIKFPDKVGSGGLVPPKGADIPHFSATAGSLSFHWAGNTGKLIEAFITFLYLDFIGSSITFVSMGAMCGILDDDGSMPHANSAFIADGLGSTMGGLLGSSALTTYVESAAAVREGGRTGVTACVCAILFFLSVFLYPIFSNIPSIATGPILVLIGVLIFMSAVFEINWEDLTDAGPAFITIIIMPTTNNIAYGCIAGFIAYWITKFVTYQLHPSQQKWPGYALYKRWTVTRSMHILMDGEKGVKPKTVAAADPSASGSDEVPMTDFKEPGAPNAGTDTPGDARV
ncbi:hypothetical protein WJX72_009909 [[Myrmecia] bisecta]|uniref:Xanthine/uracil permease n=1 Tax=[Myrmecia] bisecta TaxID=41462 RepID=A0AAW1R9B9_9CHLO